MKSMTGFAAIEKESDSLKLSIRIRSVNGRFFEFKPHMPADYFPVESEIKKRVNSFLKRGTVDIYIHRKTTGKSGAVEVVANEALAQKWLKTYGKLANKIGLDAHVQMEQISKVPGVLQVEENHKIDKAEKEFLLSCLDLALEKCLKEKQREGKAIQKDLAKILKGLEANIKKVESFRKEANKALKERYLKKLSKLGLKEDLDEARLAQEVVMQIDKLDITEELTRLREHFRAIKELFASDSIVGKKLDFYTQELLREVNTIGSKCQHSGITGLVVDSKGLIESFREIVQNVE
jgi:uncharacterized protein (TIGR00255 family)